LRGYLRKRGPNSWNICVELGRDPATGRRRQHWETVHGIKKDAENRLAHLIIDIGQSRYPAVDRSLTVDKYLNDWIRRHGALQLKEQTAEGYHSIIRYSLSPALGRLRLYEFRPHHISQYCISKLEQGLSRRTVRNHFRLLHKALNDAVKEGLLSANPCAGVTPPKVVQKEVNFLHTADLPRFFSAIQNVRWPYFYLFYTIFTTGLRRGEALALRWGDLNLDSRTVMVRESRQRVRGRDVIDSTKTPKGRRLIELLPSLVTHLRRYRGEVDTMRLLMGTELSRDDFLFAHADGRPLEPNTATHTFSKTMRAAGIDLNLRGLRHTFASIMIAAGVNIKVVSQTMGHSSVSITLDIYAHLMPGIGRPAAELMDGLLEELLGSRENGLENPLTNVDKMLTRGGKSGARLEGFEPTTLGSEDRCSIR